MRASKEVWETTHLNVIVDVVVVDDCAMLNKPLLILRMLWLAEY